MKQILVDVIQDCNLNFLLGSGLSSPFLKLLGNIETLLTQLDDQKIDESVRKLVRASLYKKFFDGAIAGNLKIIASSEDAQLVLDGYTQFLKAVNSLILKRKSTILGKQINLFTTNVDVFLEKALDDLSLEYNDGFNGRFLPAFNLSNFKKSHFRMSPHYDNSCELPVFNLLKLHGSLTWQFSDTDRIVLSTRLEKVNQAVETSKRAEGHIIEIPDNRPLGAILTEAQSMTIDPAIDAFVQAYEQLLIVNPTKEKFKVTLLNQTYYDLLRIYSNELERENTVLFVMGFSFADEHIREITIRAANSNPTLMVYIIAHDSSAKKDLEVKFGENEIKNQNFEIISPDLKPHQEGAPAQDAFTFDLPRITTSLFQNASLHETQDNSKEAFPTPESL
jgi:hypothetical protein